MSIFFLLIPTAVLTADADLIRLKQLGFTVPAERTEAPPLSVSDESGKNRKIIPGTGRVTLMTFWTTWCPPCRAELPSLQRLHNLLSPQGLRIYAVNMNEEILYVQDFLKSMEISLPVSYFPDQTNLGAYNLKGIPASYLIDKKGQVTAVLKDSTQWDNPLIIRTIRELLEETY